jgi:hypothetical protein
MIDIPLADDAIPKDAIRLTDAYECVLEAVFDHPEILPEFNEHWLDLLRKSGQNSFNKIKDPDVLDKEQQERKEAWNRDREVNLFLRLQLGAQELIARSGHRRHSAAWLKRLAF